MNSTTANGQPTVFLVDDDADVLTSLSWLLESVDLRVAAYQSPQELLNIYDPNVPGCLILDVCMPGMSGLELQIELAGRGCRHPIIFVTGHGDVSTCSKAFRRGAFDFIEKPVNDQALVDLVNQAVSADAARRIERANRPDLSSQQSRLTPREQEVMDLLVEGKSVKQIAVELGVGFPTAARHRSRVLEKMGVVNDVELVRMVLAATTLASAF
jgi:two-component system, LuxR family, response regulator FixJ